MAFLFADSVLFAIRARFMPPPPLPFPTIGRACFGGAAKKSTCPFPSTSGSEIRWAGPSAQGPESLGSATRALRGGEGGHRVEVRVVEVAGDGALAPRRQRELVPRAPGAVFGRAHV